MLLILILFISCKNSGKDQNHIAEPSKDSISFSEEVLNNSKQNSIEQYLKTYIDSINNLKFDSPLPSFLEDPQLDYKHRGIWTSMHTPISIRNAIIERVTYYGALESILKDTSKSVRQKPSLEEGIEVPFGNLSFYDLVIKRAKELDCKTK